MNRAMTGQQLTSLYLDYLDCLNRREWRYLGSFVSMAVVHNGRHIGLAGYQDMLQGDYRAIPDLHFTPELLTVGPKAVACRLVFDCMPVGIFLDLPVYGRRVRFHEHAFYGFENNRIAEVWSIIDHAAIAAQLAGPV